MPSHLCLTSFLGLYLRDLTFIEENPDWIGPKEDGVINMEKCNLIAQVRSGVCVSTGVKLLTSLAGSGDHGGEAIPVRAIPN